MPFDILIIEADSNWNCFLIKISVAGLRALILKEAGM
jgi:hypothetical protein